MPTGTARLTLERARQIAVMAQQLAADRPTDLLERQIGRTALLVVPPGHRLNCRQGRCNGAVGRHPYRFDQRHRPAG